jgi:type IV secretion system protein TrbL
MNRRLWTIRISAVAIFVLYATVAHAQQAAPSGSPLCSGVGIYDCLASQYKTIAEGWQGKLLGYAQHLFALLGVIEMSWAGITYALEKDSPNTLLATFAKKLMTIGFFFVLLQNGPTWVGYIVASFTQAGQNAGGSSSLSASAIVGVGLNCAFGIYQGLSSLGPLDRIAAGFSCGFAALVTVFAFTIVATQLFVALVESYIVTGAGVFFLGFGALRFTSDFTQKYLTYAVGVGVKLFMIYLIVGAGQQITQQWVSILADTKTFDNLIHNSLIVSAGAIMYAVVSWLIPSFASSLMSGSVSLSAGTVAATAAGVMGAAAGTALGGASVAAEGVSSIAGAAQAMNAGVGLAKAGGATGGSAMLQGIGKAVGSMASESMNGFKQSGFGQAIANSTGGRAAASLKEQTTALRASNSIVPPPAGGGGGGGGGSAPAPSPAAPAAGGPGGGAVAGANGLPASMTPESVGSVPQPSDWQGGSAQPASNGMPQFMQPSAAAPSSASASGASPAGGAGSGAPAAVASASAVPPPAASTATAAPAASAAPASGPAAAGKTSSATAAAAPAPAAAPATTGASPAAAPSAGTTGSSGAAPAAPGTGSSSAVPPPTSSTDATTPPGAAKGNGEFSAPTPTDMVKAMPPDMHGGSAAPHIKMGHGED